MDGTLGLVFETSLLPCGPLKRKDLECDNTSLVDKEKLMHIGWTKPVVFYSDVCWIKRVGLLDVKLLFISHRPW